MKSAMIDVAIYANSLVFFGSLYIFLGSWTGGHGNSLISHITSLSFRRRYMHSDPRWIEWKWRKPILLFFCFFYFFFLLGIGA